MKRIHDASSLFLKTNKEDLNPLYISKAYEMPNEKFVK